MPFKSDHPSPREAELAKRALNRPAGSERKAFLDGACAEDNELRNRVEALVSAAEETVRTTPPAMGVATTDLAALCPVDETPAARPAEQPGERIGRYRLLQKIGEGGCGIVYMAEQEEPVRRRVALKVIKLGMDTKSVVARFEAERQALAMMDHPNIAKVLDGGATEQGRPYFVMELVRGQRITDYCDQHRVSTQERLDLFVKVCQAIQHAHQKGIIHRDIKPSNILVTVNDGVAVPKVIDFGIAKAIEGRLTDQTLFTAFEQFIGTPAYMSPEQADLTSLDIDTRSDIYSLGVLLYELLTGKTPFEIKDLLAVGLDGMRRVIREQEPARPSLRISALTEVELETAARQRRAEPPKLIHLVRGDLDWIVMKTLEKDRTRRYETATSLAADIQRHLVHEPVLARPTSTLYRLRRLAWRHRAIAAGFGIALVALLLGLIASTWALLRERVARADAVLAEGKAEEAHKVEARLRKEAEKQGRAMFFRAYASDMNRAQQALSEDDLLPAKLLVENQRILDLQSAYTEASQRGWEWRYLWRQTRSDAESRLENLTHLNIRMIDVSPDGQWLAVGDLYSGKAELWNLRSRERAAEFSAGSSQALVRFSPAGSWLAYAGEAEGQHLVRLWNLESRTEARAIALTNACLGLVFSHDGASLLTASAAQYAREVEFAIWETGTGRQDRALRIDLGRPFQRDVPVCWAAESNLRFVIHPGDGSGRTLAATELDTGNRLWTSEAAEGEARMVAISPDARWAASTGDDPHPVIHLREATTGRLVEKLAGHTGPVRALAFLPGRGRLASAGEDRTIRLWNMETRQPEARWRGHYNGVAHLAAASASNTLVSAGVDGVVLVWRTDIEAGAAMDSWQLPEGTGSKDWAFRSNNVIVSVDAPGVLAQRSGVNFSDRTVLHEFPKPSIASYRFSKDGRWLAVAAEGRIEVWDVDRRERAGAWSIPGEAFLPSVHAFLADGRELITSLSDGAKYQRWAVGTGREIHSWTNAHRGTIALSPREDWAVAISLTSKAFRIDLATGNTRPIDWPVGMRHAYRPFSRAEFSPDGRYFAAAGGVSFGGPNFIASWWKLPGWQEQASLDNGGRINALDIAWSPDGRRLVTTAGGRRSVILWSPEHDLDLLTLPVAGPFCISPEFSPDGHTLGVLVQDGRSLGWGTSGRLQFWRAPSAEVIESQIQREKQN